MRNIYLAGRFRHRFFLRDVSEKLSEKGYNITSRWLYEPPLVSKKEIVTTDDYDLRHSDTVVVFQDSGDKHLLAMVFQESGYAHALNLDIIIIGDRMTPLDYRDNVLHFENLDLFYEWVGIKRSKKHGYQQYT